MRRQQSPARQLVELSREECITLLNSHHLGRIAVLEDGFPRIFPVNYRVTEAEDAPWIRLRTRPHNVIDHIGANVCFEIDGVKESRREGWSVLVCGKLDGLFIDSPALVATFQSDPWVTKDRDAWLVIEPQLITGRALRVRTKSG